MCKCTYIIVIIISYFRATVHYASLYLNADEVNVVIDFLCATLDDVVMSHNVFNFCFIPRRDRSGEARQGQFF